VKPRLFFGLAVAAQLLVLYWPVAPQIGPSLPFGDKLVHVVVFALAVWAGRCAGFSVLALVAIFAVHAPVSEILQSAFLGERAGGVGDLLADLCGIALGCVAPRTRVGYGSAETGDGPGSMGPGTIGRREGWDEP
jgi:VanZ family protein